MSKSNIKKKIAGGQLLPGVFVSLAISFLIFLYAPIDLYCANVSEFWLHYGSSATNNSINFNHKVAHKPLTMQLSPLEQQILLLFRELSESQSKLVYELIYELSRKSFGKNFSANSNQNENSNESINV